MGRPAQLSRPAVVAAAMAVADEHGLAGLTMPAVAARLGVTTMALYRHVASKDDLLDALVEALLPPLPPESGGASWRERLGAMAAAIRDTAARHPAVFPLLLQRPAATERAREIRDGVVAALRQAGLAPGPAARAERLISTAVVGYAAGEAAGRFDRHDRRVRDEDFACLLTAITALVETGGPAPGALSEAGGAFSGAGGPDGGPAADRAAPGSGG
ncbi:TetR/AcrR family transcriptional regulator [Nonomuraea wenchangensis]|uniref:DNA-binding transcriptional regulator, AcrR family n=1 Tax=Nonomuraea wenchangensis TaxID=568860 RepID=A0A1I0BV35_9ACTN|nr:TetR/AcrR family transcriptional regulator [Nonomuraea wenchangensis]SET10262.1 DNA-binding transcriptional regulator, AcrR family [Nonomuraea wenchangensis]